MKVFSYILAALFGGAMVVSAARMDGGAFLVWFMFMYIALDIARAQRKRQ